jgi:hypothetical protein
MHRSSVSIRHCASLFPSSAAVSSAILWLVSLPMIVLIAHYTNTWLRQRVVFELLNCVQATIYIVLTYLFRPNPVIGVADEPKRAVDIELEASGAPYPVAVSIDVIAQESALDASVPIKADAEQLGANDMRAPDPIPNCAATPPIIAALIPAAAEEMVALLPPRAMSPPPALDPHVLSDRSVSSLEEDEEVSAVYLDELMGRAKPHAVAGPLRWSEGAGALFAPRVIPPVALPSAAPAQMSALLARAVIIPAPIEDEHSQVASFRAPSASSSDDSD